MLISATHQHESAIHIHVPSLLYLLSASHPSRLLQSPSLSSLKIWNASQIFVSSLTRGHANLLSMHPILVYVLPKWAPRVDSSLFPSLTNSSSWHVPVFSLQIRLNDKSLYNFFKRSFSWGMQDLYLQHVGSGSLTRDQTQAPSCIGNTET